jgi:hydrogenase/urease accessory protein HupE
VEQLIMKLITRLASLSILLSPAAYAHPGHVGSDSLFHGLLHTEHLVVLFAIAAVATISYLLKDKS